MMRKLVTIRPSCQLPFIRAVRILATMVLLPAAIHAQSLTYPHTTKQSVEDDYFGTKVADPYRWLEDDNSAETKTWVEAQNKVTFGWLAEVPQREKIRSRIQELFNFERFGVPFKKGGQYFYTRNTGLQNQSVLYVTPTLDGEGRELLDPNKLSADGTVSLTETSVSEDGKLMVYGTSSAGSDWQEFRIREIATGKDQPDLLQWIKFSGAS
ncbi:MAG TPA: S9 family peptidase, partial [Candidatus Saccharimonadia bacterium]|nr:S9 family peptidase [Candidatus Saccharimonadia bacterium]